MNFFTFQTTEDSFFFPMTNGGMVEIVDWMVAAVSIPITPSPCFIISYFLPPTLPLSPGPS